MICASSPIRFRCAFEASRWPQDGPRELQERPKRPPRRPQERRRSPQERPKMRSRWPQKRGEANRGPPPSFDRWPPGLPQEALHSSQDPLGKIHAGGADSHRRVLWAEAASGRVCAFGPLTFPLGPESEEGRGARSTRPRRRRGSGRRTGECLTGPTDARASAPTQPPRTL